MRKSLGLTDALAIRRKADPVRGWRTAAALILTFCVLVVVTRLFCKDSLGNSSFWPADGALVAAMLLLPPRLSIVSVAACLAFNISANCFASYTVVDNLLFSTLNVFVSAVAALLTRRFCGAAIDLSRARRLGTFAALSLFAAAVEAGIGEPIKRLAGEPGVDLNDWLQWTLCDSMGLIIATPAILLLVKRRRYLMDFKSTRLERFLLVMLALGGTLAIFSATNRAELFFIYPLLILIAFRAGPVWVLVSVAGVAIISSAFTAHGLGPLATPSATGALLAPDVMQPFLISLIACALPSNNALNEANRAASRLTRLHRLARHAQMDAVAANQAKSQFIANISHEIRTPLNGVLGMTQVLASSDLTEAQRAHLNVIRGSGEVLLGLLNDVLDLSKIEAGKLELEITEFSVQAICSGVHATFSALADAKDVQLIDYCNVSPVTLHTGDPTRVRQILTNLVSNAVKFTEAGSVTVVASNGPDGLTLEVADTGIGIPADKIEKLFAKFEQADASTTRRFGGTGLGLSICSDLVRMMNGSIDVQSTPGVGSTFTVLLPLAARLGAETVQMPVVNNAPAVIERDAAKLRILAAEDNPTNQLVLRTLLAGLDLELFVVDNGAKAVEAWTEAAYDIILMDMQMPVMDGLTAAATIRSRETASARPRIPIIALTANVMAHQVRSYTVAGIDSVVAKPVEFTKLVEAIETVLAASEADETEDVSEAAVA
jgi:signal transduction histidine kinase/CheY-like chemotaxis protein